MSTRIDQHESGSTFGSRPGLTSSKSNRDCGPSLIDVLARLRECDTSSDDEEFYEKIFAAGEGINNNHPSPPTGHGAPPHQYACKPCKGRDVSRTTRALVSEQSSTNVHFKHKGTHARYPRRENAFGRKFSLKESNFLFAPKKIKRFRQRKYRSGRAAMKAMNKHRTWPARMSTSGPAPPRQYACKLARARDFDH